jgi:aryl sulfotransferase
MLPQLLHEYQSYIQDSTRWARFKPRDDDIIISTAPKSGTTWTQEIVLHLVFLAQEIPYYDREVCPWLDRRWPPLDEVLARLDAQRHRRFMKSHLPLDGIPYFPQVKYIVLGRDPRDVFMSMWNHYASFTHGFYERVNNMPDRNYPTLPPCPADIHDFWRPWISRGRVEWQQQGYPFFGPMHQFQSWWSFRHLPNILLVHFADLLADTACEIRRIADYLEIVASNEQIEQIVTLTNINAMRSRAEEHNYGHLQQFVDGAHSFYYKGTNGRWKDVLTEQELAMYEDTATKVLTPDCRAWLEQGTVVLAA